MTMWGLENASILITILFAVVGVVVSVRTDNLIPKVSIWLITVASALFLSFSIGGTVRSSQLTEENITLKGDKTALSGQVRDLQIQLDALRTQVENLQNDFNSDNSRELTTELENLRRENQALQAANDESTAEIARLNEQIEELQQAGGKSPPISASEFTQQADGVTYSLTEVTSNGEVTFWFTALNEGEEDNFCLYYNTNLFDASGIQHEKSYFVVNGSQENGACSYVVLPNRIPIRFGVVFSDLPTDTTEIPQFTLNISGRVASMKFRNVPVPYSTVTAN